MRGQISDDGQWWYDGRSWQPIATREGGGSMVRRPTDWTRPLHLATAAFFIVNGALTIILTLAFVDQVRQATRQALEKSNATSPNPLSADQITSAINIAVVVGIAIAVVIGLVFIVVGILALRDWTWIFYVSLVLSAFSVIGLATGVRNLTTGGQPIAESLVSFALSLLGSALFVWLLVARIKRGVWATVLGPPDPPPGEASTPPAAGTT